MTKNETATDREKLIEGRGLDELQQLADAATEGPWEAGSARFGRDHQETPYVAPGVGSDVVAQCYASRRATHDAAFIAAARSAVPALLARVRELEAALAAPVAADEAKLAGAKYSVESIHQIHGDTCLCGFSSARSRSRTEHITGALAELLGAGAR